VLEWRPMWQRLFPAIILLGCSKGPAASADASHGVGGSTRTDNASGGVIGATTDDATAGGATDFTTTDEPQNSGGSSSIAGNSSGGTSNIGAKGGAAGTQGSAMPNYPTVCQLEGTIATAFAASNTTSLSLTSLTDGWMVAALDHAQRISPDGVPVGAKLSLVDSTRTASDSSWVARAPNGFWALVGERYDDAGYSIPRAVFGQFDYQGNVLLRRELASTSAPRHLVAAGERGIVAIWASGFSSGDYRLGFEILDQTAASIGSQEYPLAVNTNDRTDSFAAADAFLACANTTDGLWVYRIPFGATSATATLLPVPAQNAKSADQRHCSIAAWNGHIIGLISTKIYSKTTTNYSATFLHIDGSDTLSVGSTSTLSMGEGTAKSLASPIVNRPDVAMNSSMMVMSYLYTTATGMAVGVGAYDGDGKPISAALKIEDTTMEAAPVAAAADDGSFGVAYLTTAGLRFARFTCHNAN
jgi:hypothetical protein